VIAHDGYELPFDINPRVIVDLGANIGLATAWFASRYPEARVIAVEPDAANFDILLSNTAALANVTAVRAAVWTASGRVGLLDPGIGPDGYRVDSISDAAVSAQSSVCAVEALDIPSLMAAHGIDRINLLKVDIEGSEREIFRDASRWIDRVDSIAIELHDRYTPGCSRAFFGAVGAFSGEATRGEDHFVWRDTVPSR
jgi:FkbM family methyltransferase